MAAGAAGAAALLAPPAHAATFPVTSLSDDAADACDATCTLRDAIAEANANDESDVITFASGLTGDIVLDQGIGQIPIDAAYGLTIDGPGAGVIRVHGDDVVRIFEITGAAPVSIEGLTLAGGGGKDTGAADPESGGAIATGNNGDLTIVDSVITGSSTTAGAGGGIFAPQTDLTLTRTSLTNNHAPDGGGIYSERDSPADFTVTLTDAVVSGNSARSGSGGGISSAGGLTVTDSTISGNVADEFGGGIDQGGKYAPLLVEDSVISGNAAAFGGGLNFANGADKYSGNSQILNSTISGNTATSLARSRGGDPIGSGGGVHVSALGDLDVIDSTISGNSAVVSGGGLAVTADSPGEVLVAQSTISGNTAKFGGGASFGDECDCGYMGQMSFENATVAANNATTGGGGLHLASYEAGADPRGDDEPLVSATVDLTSTIVGNNTVGGSANDLDRADDSTAGGFDLAFSLVEAAGDAPLFESVATNITGQDPQLYDLANNGGPTLTHQLQPSSPAIDKGDAPARLTTDQRGQARTVDTFAANAAGGDGSDIGSVESPVGPPAPPAPVTGQGASQAPPGTPGVIRRVAPLRMTATLTPSRDTEAPYTFRVTGRVFPPTPFTNAQACGSSLGLVSVQVKRVTQTISSRRVVLRPDCTFSSSVTFRNRSRFGRSTVLRFVPRFLGNQVLEPISARSLNGRVREADSNRKRRR